MLKLGYNDKFSQEVSLVVASSKLPLVSIVTPVYNAAEFLPETIRTVLDQTYENWELIFVDDDSTDESVDVIKQARKKDKRIKIVKLEQNSGAAKARNAGTMEARGDYLAFLDADDLWVKDKLEKQVEFTMRGGHAFVYSSYQFASSGGAPISEPVVVPEDINYKKSLKNPIIWTSTVLLDLNQVPKELIMMPDVRRGQDAATWWQILRETGINAYGVQEPLAYYRRTKGTLSSNKLRASKRTWYLYRKVEKLGLVKSVYYFPFYAYNAVKKRM